MLTLLGLPGVGKSSLLRHVVYHAKRRDAYLGGILFVDLHDLRSCESLKKRILQSLLMNDLSLDKSDREKSWKIARE